MLIPQTEKDVIRWEKAKKQKKQMNEYHAADQRPINSTEKGMLFDFIGTEI